MIEWEVKGYCHISILCHVSLCWNDSTLTCLDLIWLCTVMIGAWEKKTVDLTIYKYWTNLLHADEAQYCSLCLGVNFQNFKCSYSQMWACSDGVNECTVTSRTNFMSPLMEYRIVFAIPAKCSRLFEDTERMALQFEQNIIKLLIPQSWNI